MLKIMEDELVPNLSKILRENLLESFVFCMAIPKERAPIRKNNAVFLNPKKDSERGSTSSKGNNVTPKSAVIPRGKASVTHKIVTNIKIPKALWAGGSMEVGITEIRARAPKAMKR
ncbi:hypothetical protein AKJ64_03275 [candidate division MSBL1 archaeon SCGC-AAA259E17]|uniref:Uncharacterized protein n=1 Tax=candidate division MSBL1 archaeon SCGC-AAA259E17 TaxID=1698263 RepID=A0A133UE04_9EURY|nr:hypothetical protein AKJ64_03275 [candidate division MSBL1 archaeon SCGC-AAA259E17]